MSTEKSTPECDRISPDRTKMDSHLFRLFVSILLIPAKRFLSFAHVSQGGCMRGDAATPC